MALTKHLLAPIAALALLAAPAFAQEGEEPSRPAFLQAMGLLEAQSVEINRGESPFVNLMLLQGGGVRAVPRDAEETGANVIASWDFVTEDGRFVESLTLTTATIDLAEPETRRFALANLLVLRSFPLLAREFPSARLLAFGPVPTEGDLDVVQMVGNFSTPGDERSIVFRHIGAMHPERTELVVGIINVDTGVLPIRSDSDLLDTFAGQSFRTLTLVEE